MYIYPRVPLSLKILGGGCTSGTPFLESAPEVKSEIYSQARVILRSTQANIYQYQLNNPVLFFIHWAQIDRELPIDAIGYFHLFSSNEISRISPVWLGFQWT